MDSALHLNPRFDQHEVVRNSYIYGDWGSEENGGGFPLVKGVNFEIIILSTPSEYKVRSFLVGIWYNDDVIVT